FRSKPRRPTIGLPALGVRKYSRHRSARTCGSLHTGPYGREERPFKNEQNSEIRLTSVAVTINSLVKGYKLGRIEVHALRGLSLKVEAGRMVSLIGPSGSGKTTLLNILGGLDRATAGTVTVGDTTLTELAPTELVGYRRDVVGHIFQALNLIPTLTTEENVELPMMAAGVPRSTRLSRTRELLSIVGLSDRKDHNVSRVADHIMLIEDNDQSLADTQPDCWARSIDFIPRPVEEAGR